LRRDDCCTEWYMELLVPIKFVLHLPEAIPNESANILDAVAHEARRAAHGVADLVDVARKVHPPDAEGEAAAGRHRDFAHAAACSLILRLLPEQPGVARTLVLLLLVLLVLLLLLLVVVVARASKVPRLLPIRGLAVARLLPICRLAVASLLPILRLAVASLLPIRRLAVARLQSIRLAVAWLPISRLAVRLAKPRLLVARRLVVRWATATVPVVGCMRLGERCNGQRPAALDGPVGGVFQGVGGL